MRKNTQTVMIVDDDYFQQQLLKTWLEGEKYQVMIASSGDEAVRMVAQHKPDLILLDLMMPRLNGFQTATLLKENPDTRKIPIVVVTSIDEYDKRIEVLEIGVDDFLNKPVDKIELLVRVRNLLQSRAYFKQLQDRQAHLFQLENLASIGTLINSVTHEISKPLQDLQDLITEAQAPNLDASQQPALLAQASQRAERIDLVVHNLGLYIQSISKQPTTESCDINNVLAEVLELLDAKMADADIKIETDVAANLPLVLCASEGLMHVLVHLLLNAYEAIHERADPRISIAIMLTEDKHLLVSVFDNDTTVTENMYSLITDPLFSTKLPQVCASLGLALACHFIEESGGTISINSVAGRGCRMDVVLKTA